MALVRSSPCSDLKEKPKTEILFVDFVCCEGSKFGKIKGNVKNGKTSAFFDYLRVLSCMLYI